MEQWQQLWTDLIDKMAQDAEHFFTEVGEAVDLLVEAAEVIAEQTQKAIAMELEQTFPFLSSEEASAWAEWWDVDDTEEPYDFYGVEPMLGHPMACTGCCHFHGQIYGGNALVCAMHPYGPDTDTCADWEAFPPFSGDRLL